MAVKAVRKTPWFAYFPDDYRWSFIVSIAFRRTLLGAADPAEIFEVCRRLEKKVGDDRLWTREWTRMGERVYAMGQAEERAGHGLSASGHYNRACHYYQMADRFDFPKTAASKAYYKKSIDSFHRYVRMTDGPRVEIVEIPFERGKSLPAYFIPDLFAAYAVLGRDAEPAFRLSSEPLATIADAFRVRVTGRVLVATGMVALACMSGALGAFLAPGLALL
ncbi:MAG: hypothetical protein HYR52_03195 [Candidatus Tectomicrobia bacterium]|nr:hypothetical protein [Candidatus Tectomicrobia bacterium]